MQDKSNCCNADIIPMHEEFGYGGWFTEMRKCSKCREDCDIKKPRDLEAEKCYQGNEWMKLCKS
jgi:hypothetical protein